MFKVGDLVISKGNQFCVYKILDYDYSTDSMTVESYITPALPIRASFANLPSDTFRPVITADKKWCEALNIYIRTNGTEHYI